MFRLLTSELWLWVVSVYKLLSDPSARRVGLVYTKKAVTVFSTISKMTKTKKDDEAAKYILSLLEKAIILNNVIDPKEIEKLVKEIDKKTTQNLSDVKMSFDGDKIGIKMGPISAKLPISKISKLLP